MDINEDIVSKLRAMLETYKEQHGTIATSAAESMNDCTSCYANGCTGVCTHTCSGYCDGNGGGRICWQNGMR